MRGVLLSTCGYALSFCSPLYPTSARLHPALDDRNAHFAPFLIVGTLLLFAAVLKKKRNFYFFGTTVTAENENFQNFP